MKPSERCDAEVRCGQADDTGEIPKHNADRILGPAALKGLCKCEHVGFVFWW